MSPVYSDHGCPPLSNNMMHTCHLHVGRYAPLFYFCGECSRPLHTNITSSKRESEDWTTTSTRSGNEILPWCIVHKHHMMSTALDICAHSTAAHTSFDGIEFRIISHLLICNADCAAALKSLQWSSTELVVLSSEYIRAFRHNIISFVTRNHLTHTIKAI